ncbi:MAG: hypothetical protein KDA24_10535 [Deltaproteobacteria bacterium]|nr:hypothetical protein [Deltaproteobacteria bacterium]
MKRAPLFAAVALLLTGCDFFATPPDQDGLLSCDEEQPLSLLTSADDLDVDAGSEVGLRIVTAFGDPDMAAVLRIDGPDVADHIGEFWDPSVGQTMLTGTIEVGQSGSVELFRPGGGAMSGSLTLTCGAPEVCWNLIDDDGDGRVDCADPLCARVPDCEDAQEPLETETPLCSTDFVPLDVPVLRAIDDQRTLYETSPLGAGVQPTLAFWGGAEVMIPSLPPTAIRAIVRVGGGGMLCEGTPDGPAVSCDRVVDLADGDEVEFMPSDVVWLEPVAAAWESLEVHVICEDQG